MLGNKLKRGRKSFKWERMKFLWHVQLPCNVIAGVAEPALVSTLLYKKDDDISETLLPFFSVKSYKILQSLVMGQSDFSQHVYMSTAGILRELRA